MKLIFCMQISIKNVLHIDAMILDEDGQASIPKVPKIASLQYLYNISKKLE